MLSPVGRVNTSNGYPISIQSYKIIFYRYFFPLMTIFAQKLVILILYKDENNKVYIYFNPAVSASFDFICQGNFLCLQPEMRAGD